jgi:hypothetical protein
MSQAFRTPEQVAPDVGITKTELRRYCKQSGIHTRLGRNKIMIHEDDVARLVTWIREHQATTRNTIDAPEHDPFK